MNSEFDDETLDAALLPKSADIQREEALGKLTSFLSMKQGFALVFAVAHPVDFHSYITEIQSRLLSKQLFTLPVTALPPVGLLTFLRVSLPAPRPDVVMLTGFENWLLPETNSSTLSAPITEFYSSLNLTRNLFPETLRCPVIYWISPSVMQTIRKNCPDFFSIRSLVVSFPIPNSQAKRDQSLIFSLDGGFLNEAYSLSLQERDERIRSMTDALGHQKDITTDGALKLLDRLASYHQAQGQYSEAEPLFIQALEMKEMLMGRNHPDVAESLNNLGWMYFRQRRYEAAKPLLHESLKIRQATLPSFHPDIADSLTTLADLYRSQRQYIEAESLLLKSLKIRQAIFEQGHPDMAWSLNSLGVLYDHQGRYAEAEPLLLEALKIRRALLPEGHPYIATSMQNLGGLFHSQGRYDEAEELYLEALKIRRAAFPIGHLYITFILDFLGRLYENMGRYSEAEPLFREAVLGSVVSLGEQHPDVNLYIMNHIRCLNEIGSLEKSLSTLPPIYNVIHLKMQSVT